MKRVLIALGSLALLWSTNALAQDDAPPVPPAPTTLDEATKAEPAKPAPPMTAPPMSAAPAPAEQTQAAAEPRYDLFEANIGFRQSYLRSSGFDPYSTNDVLSQFSLGVTAPVFHRGKLALAAGAAYSAGGSSASIRGDATHLFIHDLSAVLEGRFHFASWAFAFARVAPGATAMLANVQDNSSPALLADTKWAFSTDFSAGAAILLGPRWPDKANTRTPRFWLSPEIGYGFSTKATFDSRPDRDSKDVLGSDERLALPSLSTSALFWRITLAATF